jgi:cytidylate kinase
MAVITISQGTHSGGRMLAQSVAERLGYRCIHREQVLGKAALWGVSAEDLRAALEKPPSFFGQSQHTKYRYLAFIQAALADEVREGNAIYTGLAGHLLLGKGPHVLRTRIIAPMSFRIAMVEAQRGCSRSDAIAYIQLMDQQRSKWTRFLHGVDWTDESLYDLVLNLEQMTLLEASDVLCLLAATGNFTTTPETQADLNNLALASGAKAALAADHDTSNLEFEITADSGTVVIKGAIDGPVQARKVRGIVETLPGVRGVSVKELALVHRM